MRTSVVGLVILVLGCAGPAASPAGPGGKGVSVDSGPDSPGLAGLADGLAFAEAIPSKKKLGIYVYSADVKVPAVGGVSRTVTCKNIHEAGVTITKGLAISFGADAFDGAPGKYAVTGMTVTKSRGSDRDMAATVLPGTSIQIASYDDKSMTAEITSTSASGARASGTVTAVVCPAFTPGGGVTLEGSDTVVEFAKNSASLSAAAKSAADGIATKILAGHDTVKVTLQAYVEQDDPKQAPKLGDARTAAIMAYLTQKGVPSTLFAAPSPGEGSDAADRFSDPKTLRPRVKVMVWTKGSAGGSFSN